MVRNYISSEKNLRGHYLVEKMFISAIGWMVSFYLIFELLPIYLFTSLTFIENWLTDHNTSLPLICGCTALRKNVCPQQQACHSIFIPSSSLTVLVFIVPFTSNIHVIPAEFLLLLYSLKGSAWQAKGFFGNKQY